VRARVKAAAVRQGRTHWETAQQDGRSPGAGGGEGKGEGKGEGGRGEGEGEGRRERRTGLLTRALA